MSTYPYWCCESYSIDGKNSSWSPVTQTDHKILEDAFRSQEKGLVYIESRRTSAELQTRTLRGCYDFPPHHISSCPPLLPRRMIRATWFYLDSSDKEVPLSEEAGSTIENWFNAIKHGQPTADDPFTAEMDLSVVLNNKRDGEAVTHKVRAVKELGKEQRTTMGQRLPPPDPSSKIEGFTVKMHPKSNILQLGSLTLQRGLTPPPRQPEEDWASLQEQDHLVLVVHGIGQHYFAGTDDSFENGIVMLRKNLMEQRCALDEEDASAVRGKDDKDKRGAGKDVALRGIEHGNEKGHNPSNHKLIECLGIEWFDEVHNDSIIGMKPALEKVTLPSVKSIRKLAHDVALDVMLYLTPEFKQRILCIVVEKINLMYFQFCELNPSFVTLGRKCSLVGHSLGTVILYDILSMQGNPNLPEHLKLSFDPTAYFSLGSPVGMFLTLRNSAARVHNSSTTACKHGGEGQIPVAIPMMEDDVLNASYSFPTCKQFFNVFNKNDPVAYRVEPLAEESLQQEEPLIVPHYDGGLRPQYLLKSMATSISETWRSLASPSGWFKSATSTSTTISSTSTCIGDCGGSGNDSQPPLSLLDSDDSDHLTLQKRVATRRGHKICPPNSLPHVRLNHGRRFDFLLQESALESANEYLSSLTSHTSYFEQKDVARFIAAMLLS